MSKKNIYFPSAEIPRDVYRAIVAQGGIVHVTVARHAEHAFETIWIDMQR